MGVIITVSGPVPEESLGITLAHEHLLIDLTPWLDPPSADPREQAPVALENLGWQRRDPLFRGADNNRLDDVETAVNELLAFRLAGGSSLVDLTSTGLEPRPEQVREIARRSGVNIIHGCGYYRVVGHPPWLLEAPVEMIVDRLTQQVREGIAGTSVLPGMIGELGTSEIIHPSERRVLQAAARVQQQTQLAVNIHTDPWARRGLEALDVFERAGGDPTRTVISHLDHVPIELAYLRALAARGVVLEFDGFGCEWYVDGRGTWLPRDTERLDAIARLVDAGFGSQIVVGSDTCRKIQLRRYGGWGYEHIPRHIAPMMQRLGFADSDIAAVLIETPRRLLALERAA